MADKPLLIFPTPEPVDRDKQKTRPSEYHHPTFQRQCERVAPKLSSLKRSFDSRAIEITKEEDGIDPEQVLVIETIGSVENFANAVVKIPGFEWLGEWNIEDISPDEDFYDRNNEGKLLRGRLYVVMSNRKALDELLSLWKKYSKDPKVLWARGFARFRDVFDKLYDVRKWGVQDRLAETGIIDAWKEELEFQATDPIKFEIELWFRNSESLRREAERQVRELVEELGGSFLRQAQIPEIHYHSVLVDLPPDSIDEIIGNVEVELVKCDSIMFFRPVGQITAGKEGVEKDADFTEDQLDSPLPTGDPVVAVLDGMPLQNHLLLTGRIRVDDPDAYELDCPAIRRVHGTSMCSLVVHGDLNGSRRPLVNPIYVRPIMKPISWHREPWPEQLPTNEISVDLIHRSVRRLFEAGESSAAAAPTVKIVNLSIGDPSRPYLHFMSPLARLLDWLSFKYRILFVVSAGNYPQDIELSISETEFRSLDQNERLRLVVRHLYNDIRNRKIMSPAESINAITVGAIHFDHAQETQLGRLVELYETAMVSPVSGFGAGHGRSVKPDLVFQGGRSLFNFSLDGTALSYFARQSGPGQRFAAPGVRPGDLQQTAHGSGTSCAAASLTHELGHCYTLLREILDSQPAEFGEDVNLVIAPLLKAMIVHGCSWGEVGERLRDILGAGEKADSVKSWISQWIGYGAPDLQKVESCTDQRATVLGFGQLLADKADVFRLPLPPGLGSKTVRRRLTITLACLSPASSQSQKYRSAQLWFKIPKTALADGRKDCSWQAVRRGTLHHEVFEGDEAFPISDGDYLTIKVNCRRDAGRFDAAIPYGLIVSLEVAEGVDIPIYQEVQDRIRPKVPAVPGTSSL